MSNVESAIIPGIRITSTWHLALAWIGASIVAVPLAVLLHELGHVVFYPSGFPDVVLHYNSATYATERTFWQLISRGNFAAAASTIPALESGDRYCRRITCYVRRSPRFCFFAGRKIRTHWCSHLAFSLGAVPRESRCFWPGFREDL